MTLLSKKNTGLKNYFFYYMIPFTAAFLLLQFIIYYPFRSGGKSFIWNMDGINQHYPALVYYSNLLKDLFGGRKIPMVDFKLGMGFDTLTTLNYYAIGDPITLLTVFGKENNMEVVYRFLILLRLYLSGISFMLYCIYMKKKGFSSVLGGLIYVFCGYVFYAGTRHPYFTNPMIYLPLLFIGVDLIIQKKKPYLFVIMTCISALSNFYFFYMLTILVLVYALIRFFYTYNKNEDKSVFPLFLRTALRAGLYYTLGLVMASFILLPVLAAFMGNGRFNSGYQMNLFHYDLSYYLLIIHSFIAPNISPGFWTQCTFAAIVPVAVWIVVRNREYRELRMGFIIGTIGLMIPFIGYLMNGMSYVCNRWEFGYSFLLAFIVVSVYEKIFQLKKQDKIVLLGGTGLYGAAGLIKPSWSILFAFLILCITVFSVLFFNFYKKSKYLQRTVIFSLIFCNLAINGYMTYSGRYGNYVNEFIASGEVDKTIRNSAVGLIPGIRDNSFFRIETYGDKWLNEAITVGYNDVSGYFSIMDKRTAEYMKGLEMLNQKTSYRFDNLDYRTGIGTLAGVKYMISPKKDAVPYGYKLLTKEKFNDKTYRIYENQYALPLGYTYDKYITRDVYESLTAIQKQEVMLQAVVLEKPINRYMGIIPTEMESGKVIGNKTSFLSEKIPISIEYGKGISFHDNLLKVEEPGAKIKVYFDGVKDSEAYLRLNNFNIGTDFYAMNFYIKNEKGVNKTINARSVINNAYFGKEDYLINLGYDKGPMRYCVLTFPKTGIFHLDGIEGYALPMSNYIQQVKDRKSGAFYNIMVGTNQITGMADSKKDSILCLSIPYNKGWSAYVNGKKQKLLQANVMYMALELDAGKNDIKLFYTTPYLKAGIALSAAGWFVFFCIIIFNLIIKLKSGKNYDKGDE
ncbi:YfhO family protein [Anaerocolumna sp. MB42-C2]|uniref:YfhO family protein n=1 Tax=Anaerocolumna sp. MB42-C2 TaxID=3070997 RepID=UPI0027DF45E3|nr:YfhO family protein [Anaerocolumna sp. MB42-C2]WMJ87523.1 YfhO family protein [Anaerocolumna sp. MB42-C2]